MKKKLDLIIDEDCGTCKRIEKQLLNFISKRNDVKFEIKLKGKIHSKKIIITPALLIDGSLFKYGELDFVLLEEELSG